MTGKCLIGEKVSENLNYCIDKYMMIQIQGYGCNRFIALNYFYSQIVA